MRPPGSPPHGRGKVVLRQVAGAPARITPAWAGKSSRTCSRCRPEWDHPRVGGEKARPCIAPPPCRGSPPRGRGKGLTMESTQTRSRITPAWAGKSTCKGQHPECGWDHPRVGGEKSLKLSSRWRPGGSPPRGRGKAGHCQAPEWSYRITPAWAGKRWMRSPPSGSSRDHPRVGGEKFHPGVVTNSIKGSPPRGRGKGRRTGTKRCQLRITPAWAGKRLKRSHRSGIFISGPIPFHSALHRPAGSDGSQAGRDGSPAGQPQNAGPA